MFFTPKTMASSLRAVNLLNQVKTLHCVTHRHEADIPVVSAQWRFIPLVWQYLKGCTSSVEIKTSKRRVLNSVHQYWINVYLKYVHESNLDVVLMVCASYAHAMNVEKIANILNKGK